MPNDIEDSPPQYSDSPSKRVKNVPLGKNKSDERISKNTGLRIFTNDRTELQDMDPNDGQLVSEILKKGGEYHPESTRNDPKKNAHITGRFGFSEQKME